jgi:hypothetical protein
MNINVATVHWKSRFFQAIQSRHIDLNMEGARVWAFVDKVGGGASPEGANYHFEADSGQTNHLVKLDMLADRVTAECPDDDVLLFMDGDAWPIRPVSEFISNSLGRLPVGGVVRLENGERYPHPCFTFTTVGFWKEASLSWSKHDVNHILHVLEARKQDWVKLRRTGGLSDHPVFFSVYGDMVYHHGAGFRVPVSAYCNRTGAKVTKEESLAMLEVFMERFSPRT